MHVKIPNGSAIPLPALESVASDDDDRQSKVKFTNNLREFIDVHDVEAGVNHQMRPNQAMEVKTHRGNHLIVKNN